MIIMVTDISEKALKRMKKIQGKFIEYDKFHKYLEEEFKLTPHQANLYLQEMDQNKLIIHATGDKPMRLYLTPEGENLVDSLSAWEWFRRNAIAISCLVAIVGLIVTIALSI